MSQNDTLVDEQNTELSEEEKAKEKSDKLTDFLQAPRRKRKSYVIMALGRGTGDLGGGIETFVRANFKTLAVGQPRSVDELRKTFTRQIVLMIFDDEFVPLEEGLELVKELKRKKNSSNVPVLFLTRQPERLVEAYNRMLLPFQESDEYMLYPKAELNHILSKVRTGLAGSYRRRSRRYKVDIDLQYLLLADDKMHGGRLQDLSIHGGMLRADEERLFRLGEQLKIHLPVQDYLPANKGDFLKLSAKVRRVFIGGTQAGISFEHLSEQQVLQLTQFLTEMVNDQMARKVAATKARGARA